MIKTKIIEDFKNKYLIECDKKGYLKNIKSNLLEGIELNLFEEDYRKGSGNELESKFMAIHSSAALVVNNFAILKKLGSRFKFLNFDNIEQICFEKQCPSGLLGTPPNLDVFLENNSTVIGIESKFTETLTKKKVNFSSSYNSDKLSYLSPKWFEIIEKYNNQTFYLDIAQLIKHSIGLINYKRKKFPNKKIVLIYLYWLPVNHNDFENYKSHLNELSNFIDNIKNTEIEFIAMSYLDLWNEWSKDDLIKEHLLKIKERYLISL